MMMPSTRGGLKGYANHEPQGAFYGYSNGE